MLPVACGPASDPPPDPEASTVTKVEGEVHRVTATGFTPSVALVRALAAGPKTALDKMIADQPTSPEGLALRWAADGMLLGSPCAVFGEVANEMGFPTPVIKRTYSYVLGYENANVREIAGKYEVSAGIRVDSRSLRKDLDRFLAARNTKIRFRVKINHLDAQLSGASTPELEQTVHRCLEMRLETHFKLIRQYGWEQALDQAVPPSGRFSIAPLPDHMFDVTLPGAVGAEIDSYRILLQPSTFWFFLVASEKAGGMSAEQITEERARFSTATQAGKTALESYEANLLRRGFRWYPSRDQEDPVLVWVGGEFRFDSSMFSQLGTNRQSEDGFSVFYSFKPRPAERFSALTRKYLGERIAEVFRDRILFSPTIRSALPGTGVILGLSAREVMNLVLDQETGARSPVDVKIVQQEEIQRKR